MATCSSTLAWEITRTEESGGLQSTGSQRVEHNLLTEHTLTYTHIYINTSAAAAAKSRKSCLTLCDPIDGSPPSSPIPGILQARTLEWVAISFSNA